MLDLRPNCEKCDRDLPPESTLAMICTFECTFCRDCVEQALHNVCPNCGGGLTPRPIRPSAKRERFPPSTKRVGPKFDATTHAQLLGRYRDVAPEDR